MPTPHLAEAFAWMLTDAAEYDAAINILEVPALTSPEARTRLRLAEALNFRNTGADRQRASRMFLTVAMDRPVTSEQRGYAWCRWGAGFRHGGHGRTPFRHTAQVLVYLAPLLALRVVRNDANADAVRSYAYRELGHSTLRLVEVIAPNAIRLSTARAILARVATVGRGWLSSAGVFAASRRQGNAMLFIEQQSIELRRDRSTASSRPRRRARHRTSPTTSPHLQARIRLPRYRQFTHGAGTREHHERGS